MFHDDWAHIQRHKFNSAYDADAILESWHSKRLSQIYCLEECDMKLFFHSYGIIDPFYIAEGLDWVKNRLKENSLFKFTLSLEEYKRKLASQILQQRQHLTCKLRSIQCIPYVIMLL